MQVCQRLKQRNEELARAAHEAPDAAAGQEREARELVAQAQRDVERSRALAAEAAAEKRRLQEQARAPACVTRPAAMALLPYAGRVQPQPCVCMYVRCAVRKAGPECRFMSCSRSCAPRWPRRRRRGSVLRKRWRRSGAGRRARCGSARMSWSGAARSGRPRRRRPSRVPRSCGRRRRSARRQPPARCAAPALVAPGARRLPQRLPGPAGRGTLCVNSCVS